MVELGELEKRHEDFESKKVRIVAVSQDKQADAALTKAEFPHLTIVADAEQSLAKAVQVVHAGMGPGGVDTNVPTTILLDRTGAVRWVYRADRFTTRATTDEVLAAIRKNLP